MLQRAEANIWVKDGTEVIFRGQKIPQPAADQGHGRTVDHVVGGDNVKALRLRSRPTGNFGLQTLAAETPAARGKIPPGIRRSSVLTCSLPASIVPTGRSPVERETRI